MKDKKITLEELLLKPNTPINPTMYNEDDTLFVVSHIPFPMRTSTLIEKRIPNERIKAAINASAYQEYQRQTSELDAELKDILIEELGKASVRDFKYRLEVREINDKLNKIKQIVDETDKNNGRAI